MITLITGAPGCGKTAFAVSLLLKSEYYPGNSTVFNVRDWSGGGTYFDTPAEASTYEKPRHVYLVDEAQTFWPSRVAGRPVPAIVDHLAKHRHISQDWILTCQHPGQLEIGIRRLVGRHIHLTRTPLGVKFSEAGECVEDLKFTRDQSRKYDFPVESLKLYKSDEGVTSHQKKGLQLPKRLIFLVGLIGFLAATGVYFWNKSDMFGGGDDEVVATGISPQRSARADSAAPNVMTLQTAPDVMYFRPPNPDFPEVAKAPRFPVSCIASKAKCLCYDQASQVISDLSPARCRAIVSGNNPLAVLYPGPLPVDNTSPRPQEASQATAAPPSGA